MKFRLLERFSNWYRRKVTSRKYFFLRKYFSEFIGLDRQLARIYSLPNQIDKVLILGRGASLLKTVHSINVSDFDLILVVNECDYLLNNTAFQKIINSNKPIIQYLNNAEVVHSIKKTRKLNLWGFWLSVPKEDGTWREGISKRRFRGPESLGSIPRYAPVEMIKMAEQFLPLNAGLLCILQAIYFHNPKSISIAGFDFYKNAGQVHIDNAFLESKELPALRKLSTEYELSYIKIINHHHDIQFNLYS